MNKTIIAQSPQFTLVSYGNGEAYALEPAYNSTCGAYVFVQGDDATRFWEDYEGLCEWKGRNQALFELWREYATNDETEEVD